MLDTHLLVHRDLYISVGEGIAIAEKYLPPTPQGILQTKHAVFINGQR